MGYKEALKEWYKHFEPGEIVTDEEGIFFTLGYIAQQLDKIVELTETAAATPTPASNEAMNVSALQARADYNREHAAELYSDKLVYNDRTKRWYEWSSGEDVVFTPYGWLYESDAMVAKTEPNVVK